MDESELKRFGWRYYSQLIVGSAIIVAGFMWLCLAFTSGEWRWLVLCAPLLLLRGAA